MRVYRERLSRGVVYRQVSRNGVWRGDNLGKPESGWHNTSSILYRFAIYFVYACGIGGNTRRDLDTKFQTAKTSMDHELHTNGNHSRSYLTSTPFF